MKYFKLVSMILILVTILLLGSQLINQTKDVKIKAFNESLALENDKKYDKALNKLNEIYDSNTDDYLINLRLGWLNYLTKRYDESISFYNKAFSLSKGKSVEALLGLTYPQSAKGDWSSVIKTYKKVLDLSPDNYIANLRLGQILLNSKKYVEALDYLETAYNAYPSEYEVNVSLSWVYYYLGQFKDAKKLFTNTLMLSPNDSLATIGYNLVK